MTPPIARPGSRDRPALQEVSPRTRPERAPMTCWTERELPRPAGPAAVAGRRSENPRAAAVVRPATPLAGGRSQLVQSAPWAAAHPDPAPGVLDRRLAAPSSTASHCPRSAGWQRPAASRSPTCQRDPLSDDHYRPRRRPMHCRLRSGSPPGRRPAARVRLRRAVGLIGPAPAVLRPLRRTPHPGRAERRPGCDARLRQWQPTVPDPRKRLGVHCRRRKVRRRRRSAIASACRAQPSENSKPRAGAPPAGSIGPADPARR